MRFLVTLSSYTSSLLWSSLLLMKSYVLNFVRLGTSSTELFKSFFMSFLSLSSKSVRESLRSGKPPRFCFEGELWSRAYLLGGSYSSLLALLCCILILSELPPAKLTSSGLLSCINGTLSSESGVIIWLSLSPKPRKFPA